MCTWTIEKADIAGHGKGVTDWLPLTRANVYYDHPVSAPLDHALIIDFVNDAAGPGARVCVELSAESAQALLRAIQAALDTGQARHDLSRAASPPRPLSIGDGEGERTGPVLLASPSEMERGGG